MATVPVTPAPHVSWLKKLGRAIVHGFEGLESPKGQALIAATEAITEAIFPVSAPIVALVNVWMQKAAIVEAKGQAAADLGASATGAQKAVAAISAVAPDVEAILKQYNLLPLSPASMQIINDAVIAIANEVVPVPAATPPAA